MEGLGDGWGFFLGGTKSALGVKMWLYILGYDI